jgi:hypothetical protein
VHDVKALTSLVARIMLEVSPLVEICFAPARDNILTAALCSYKYSRNAASHNLAPSCSGALERFLKMPLSSR